LRKSHGSQPAPTASRWIKPGAREDAGDVDGPDGDDEEQQREEKGGKTPLSAPPSCYSMATAAAAVGGATTGLRQKTVRTTRSFASRSTSHLSSYDLASALQTINHIIISNKQKATRLIGPEDPASSPRKRSDKVLTS